MIKDYISSLQNGLQQNRKEFLTQNKMNEDDLLNQAKEARLHKTLSNKEMRQMEVRGYEQMLQRILDVPLQSSIQSNNNQMVQQLSMIKSTLSQQQNIIFEKHKKQITQGSTDGSSKPSGARNLLMDQMKHLKDLESDSDDDEDNDKKKSDSDEEDESDEEEGEDESDESSSDDQG